MPSEIDDTERIIPPTLRQMNLMTLADKLRNAQNQDQHTQNAIARLKRIRDNGPQELLQYY